MTARTEHSDFINAMIARDDPNEIKEYFRETYANLTANLKAIDALKSACEDTKSKTCGQSQQIRNELKTQNIYMRTHLKKLISTNYITEPYVRTIIVTAESLGGSKRKTTKGRRKQNKSRRNRKSRR